MAEKPFPFNVCKECCGTGGGDVDLSNYYTKKETETKISESIPKWKTLINMTLTAEQAGSTGMKIEIPDYLSFANARKIRFAMSMPVGEAYAANQAWARVRFKDFDGVAYDQSILAGHNKALTANSILYMTAAVDVFDFKYNETYKRSFHSVFQLPNSHYTAPENSITTASECTGAFPRDYMLQNAYHPYLSIVTGSSKIPLSEGTHIFLEVCEV